MPRVLGVRSKRKNCSKRTAVRGAAPGRTRSISMAASTFRKKGKPPASCGKGTIVSKPVWLGGKSMTEYLTTADVRILQDPAAIANRAAQEFVRAAAAAVQEKASFNVALAGGSTPKALYNLLVSDPLLRSQVPWDKMHVFFGDERHVGPGHPDSNFRMTTETMLSKAPLKGNQITRIKGEYPDAGQAAREYEEAIAAHFKLKAGELPRFDLLLAGMGNEGHTLSLFPGTKALHAHGHIAVRNWVGKLYTDPITFNTPAP